MLPSEYNFSFSSSYAELYAVAEYLKEEYSGYINMENPTINISGGDFSYDGEQKYSISFFDSDTDIVQKIINYNFNCVTFGCDDDGKLSISRIYRPDLSDKIGDYPIISEENALELLKNKHYITTVPEEFPGEGLVKKVELVYRDDKMDKTFLPYYRFYVELPSMKLDNGLSTYGAYYVPAIPSKYITNMPLWDGSFN